MNPETPKQQSFNPQPLKPQSSNFSKVLWGFMSLFSLGVAGYAFAQYSSLDITQFGLYHEGFSKIREVSLFIHILGGAIALLVGPFQFSTGLRKASPLWHRRLGKLYFVGIALGGIAGVIVSIYTDGVIAKIGFASLSLMWLATGWQGLATIKKGDVKAHQAWMVRNFALSFAGVTFRIGLPILIALTGDFFPAYQIISWLCWIPNLIVAELIFIPKAQSLFKKKFESLNKHQLI